jgi:hypothetical protein
MTVTLAETKTPDNPTPAPPTPVPSTPMPAGNCATVAATSVSVGVSGDPQNIAALIWQCTLNSNPYTPTQAQTYCSSLGYGSNSYWSSTPYGSSSAWYVIFGNGNVYHDTNGAVAYARCVR